MQRIRSPRRWWRDSVLAPLDVMFARIDRDVAALTDAQPVAAVAPSDAASLTSDEAIGSTRATLGRSA